jgi:hypothetical protein
MRNQRNKQQPHEQQPLEQQNHDFSVRDLFTPTWNPQPVNPPEVDPEIEDRDPLTRSAESIRYSILSIEFWISPKGQVREWLRNNTRLAVLLAIPVFLVLPIITFGLWQLVSWLTALNSIAGKLIVLPLLALIAALIITLAWTLVKAVMASK